jgi:hypothetical protein
MNIVELLEVIFGNLINNNIQMSKSLLNIDKFPTGIINDETNQTVDGFVDMV